MGNTPREDYVLANNQAASHGYSFQYYEKEKQAMKHRRSLQLIIGLTLVLLFVLACTCNTLQTGITPTSKPAAFNAKPGKWSGQDVSFEVSSDGKIAVLKFTARYVSGGSLTAEYLYDSDIPVNPDGTFESRNDKYSITGKFNSSTTASFTYEIYKGMQGQTVSGTGTSTVEWKSP